MSASNVSALLAPSTSVPSASAPTASPSWWGANLSLNFNVKTTLIYVGKLLATALESQVIDKLTASPYFCLYMDHLADASYLHEQELCQKAMLS